MAPEGMSKAAKRNAERATAEINAILDKYQCMLLPEVRIIGSKIQHNVHIAPRPPKVDEPCKQEPIV